MILGADHHRMADFYNLENDDAKPNLPVIYLKKNYITQYFLFPNEPAALIAFW